MSHGETNLHISEIFHSLQGEGRLAGVPSAFIRLAGCHLRCRWCDTPYALGPDQGRQLTIEAILSQVSAYNCPHVVVTGGEPLIASQLPELLHTLKLHDKHITVETSAPQFLPLSCDLISISPKLSNSDPEDPAAARAHQSHRLNLTALQSFIDSHDYQLKFVVQASADLDEIQATLSQLQNVDRERVMLMPQARTKDQYRRRAAAVAQLALDHNYRFSPRLHLELWGNRRRR